MKEKYGMNTGKTWPTKSGSVSRTITRRVSSVTPVMELEEIGGNNYNDFGQVRAVLLPGLAVLLAEAIRCGLENGKFRIIDGKVK